MNVIGSGLLPAYSRLVPRKRLKKLLKTISDKIPPLSEADEGILIVRLPILSAALQAAESAVLEEVVSEIESDEGIPVTELLGGLTEYVLSDEHLTSVRNAGALCVYALLKSGFNRNLDCPAKPLLNDINDRILSSSNDLRATRNCLNYLSLLVSCYFQSPNLYLFGTFDFFGRDLSQNLIKFVFLLAELGISTSWRVIAKHCGCDCAVLDGTSMRRICTTAITP